MGIASVNGIEVGFDDVGEGPPVLLVHGHPFDRSMWTPQVASLSASGVRVIAPDLRGYGRSTVVPGTTALSVFADDLAALLDHLGVGQVVVGGLSMGGQVAMEFVRRFADRVRALVLADTFAGPDDADGVRARLQTADRLVREGMRGYAEENLTRMMAPYNVSALPEVASHVRAMMLGAPPEGAAAALRGRAARPDYRPVLRGVTVPTLVVVGRDDDFTPVTDAQELCALVPHATLVVVEAAGHLPNLERPAAFNDAVRQFLAAASQDLVDHEVGVRDSPPTPNPGS